MKAADALDLLDWKREIFDLYRSIRSADDPRAGWELWATRRNELFRTHPQSALPPSARAGFEGLDLWPYAKRFRVLATVEEAPPERYDIPTSGSGLMSFSRVGVARFELLGEELELELYWLETYGGGLFVPFKDSTSGTTSYGGGRYLLDTVKGSDLGADEGRLILDFNFAYNPSCSYDPRWVCPLAPPPNQLPIPVEAGERHGS